VSDIFAGSNPFAFDNDPELVAIMEVRPNRFTRAQRLDAIFRNFAPG
jgi:hypothetical protein